MKKISVFLTMLLVVIGVYAKDGNGLLWKISGNGMERPAYILGSYHLAPASFIDSIPGLRPALEGVDAVYGEIEKDALMSPEAQQKMLNFAMAPADSTLSKLLTPAELAQVDSLFTALSGMPGLVGQFEMFKPAFVSSQMAVLQLMKYFPETQFTEPFDTAVMTIGEDLNKEIGGLETVDSQLGLLFGGPLTLQAEDLMEGVRDNEKQMEQARELTKAYFDRDLDALTAISEDPAFGIEPETLDRLIYDRNRAWADQLATLLPEKSLLLVVGCGHLGGDNGVLNLLRNKGFNVEPVNE